MHPGDLGVVGGLQVAREGLPVGLEGGIQVTHDPEQHRGVAEFPLDPLLLPGASLELRPQLVVGVALLEAETFAAMARLAAGGRHRKDLLRESWEKVLFAQFHDILPGSGIAETRLRNQGQFQDVCAAAGMIRTNALRALAALLREGAGLAGRRVGVILSGGNIESARYLQVLAGATPLPHGASGATP